MLVRAQQVHPLDYFYALSFAQLEPIKGAPGQPSPRLHALNRALQLCPSCEAVHAEVASNLWRLGFRSQALLEWRAAVDLQPALLKPVLGQAVRGGRASPKSWRRSPPPIAGRMVEVANFLSSISRVADAFVVLDQADAMGKPGPGELARSRQAPAAVGADRRRAEDHRGRARGRRPGRPAVAARGEGPARGQGRGGGRRGAASPGRGGDALPDRRRGGARARRAGPGLREVAGGRARRGGPQAGALPVAGPVRPRRTC